MVIGAANILLLVYVHAGLTSKATPQLVQETFHLYYQPLIPFVVMLWGWALNVMFFERTGLRYEVCFDADSADSHGHHGRSPPLLSAGELLRLSNVLTLALFSSAVIFLRFAGQGNIWAAAMQPVALYLSALLVLFLPLDVFHRETRRFFAKTLWRTVTPFRTVTWADFLLADILTSLAKGISDVERAVCSMASGPISDLSTHSLCTDISWTIPLAIALPYLWRFFQCVRVYRETGNRQQLWYVPDSYSFTRSDSPTHSRFALDRSFARNALKYTTAFPVVFLSYAKYHISHDEWVMRYKPMWLLAALVNSSFSYFWDLERDWEISFFSAMRKQKTVLVRMDSLRPALARPTLSLMRLLTHSCQVRPVFPRPTQVSDRAYLYLMASNLLLRLSWTYKLSPHLRHDHAVVFCIVILEVVRRCQWIAVRFEVELRKLQGSDSSLLPLVPGKQRRLGGIPGGGDLSPRII